MNIEIEDLQVGDEILICCQTSFKRLRLINKPSLNKDGYWKRVKCDIRNDNVGGEWVSYNFKNTDYNDTTYIDLRGRDIWLINRKTI
jgi:hypothetical protein